MLAAVGRSKAERIAAQKAFLKKRSEIWNDIQEGRFPATYTSTNNRTFVGAPRRTAIRCDFLLASKAAIGPKYERPHIGLGSARTAVRRASRSRGAPEQNGKKFYCCPKCTSKLYECVSAKVFRHIDNAKWKSEIETGQRGAR